MCGIALYIGAKSLETYKLDRVASSMKNRGPDHQGHRTWNFNDFSVSFVHARLSIIDIGPSANQPFSIDSMHLIFNGEIYNYIEVRDELKKLGVEFKTASDTEVLLRSYIQWGSKCLDKLEGMWSFAIFNEKDRSVFISRDRFGEKPLYYTKTSDGVFFASQTRTLNEFFDTNFTINSTQIQRYLCYGYKSLYKSDDDYFVNVNRFPASTFTVLSQKNIQNLKFEKYWMPRIKPDLNITPEDASNEIKSLLHNSLNLRLRADVPMAFCLSGGIDSASLVSMASKTFSQKIHCFSIIDEDPRYNEEENIDAVIKDTGSISHKVRLNYDSMKERMIDLIKYHNAPIATISYLIHSMLSEKMNQQGFKVAFSGTSADELFTGYYDHFNLYLYEMRNKPKYLQYEREWFDAIGQFVRNPHLKNPKLYFDNPKFREHIYLDAKEFEQFMVRDFHEDFTEMEFDTGSLLRNRMLNELFIEATPIILNQDDLNSMRYSIENRSPYLDRKLVEYSFKIPDELLIGKGFGKKLLRDAMKSILVDNVLWDKRKKGFNASVTSFFDFKDKSFLSYLLDRKSRIFEYVKQEKIKALLEPNSKSDSLNKFIFYFISAKMFLDSQD